MTGRCENEADESAATEAVLERDLARIVAACLELVPDPQAIVLYGGYGRGEGSWYRDETAAWRPYNDYDLLLVCDERIPKARLAPLRTALAREIGIRWIDISVRSIGELAKSKPSILDYDTKYASRVVHGDSKVLDHIPEIRADRLPSVEARVLYFTRLYTLVGSLDADGFETTLAGERSRFFRNQLAKAVLAVVDVLLLGDGAYDASYRVRVDRVRQRYPERSELTELAAWALAEKLRPTAPAMDGAAIRELYFRVRELFLSEMYVALGRHFGRDIRGPEDVEFSMRWLPAQLARRVYWLAKFRSRIKERELAVGLAQAYLVSACRREGIFERDLGKAFKLLRFVDSQIPPRLDWNAARLESARLRMEL